MTSSVSLMKASYVYPQLGVIRQMICVVQRLNVSLRLCAAGWFPFVEMKSHRLLSEVLSFRVFCARCMKVNCWISQTAKPPSQAREISPVSFKTNKHQKVILSDGDAFSHHAADEQIQLFSMHVFFIISIISKGEVAAALTCIIETKFFTFILPLAYCTWFTVQWGVLCSL